MRDRREHERIPISVKVKIMHPTLGEKIYDTKNISDTGLYLISEAEDLPAIGEVIQGQVQGMIANPPLVKLEVVRIDKQGVGLKFLENDQDSSD